ncbi:MAG: hypothetical protein MUF62_01840, partial [Chitinophagaceae bacterium]|nr:hypothetical protein [Chitinophagaceae bacterium]
PGITSSSPTTFAPLGNRLYFTASNGTNGREIWVTDGTNAGTQLVADLRAGTTSSDITSFRELNGALFFALTTPETGREIWKLQPAASATTWTGAANTDWANAANWSNGVPTQDSQVTIPAAVPRFPVINGQVNVRQLTIASGASVQVATGANLQVSGN